MTVYARVVVRVDNENQHGLEFNAPRNFTGLIAVRMCLPPDCGNAEMELEPDDLAAFCRAFLDYRARAEKDEL